MKHCLCLGLNHGVFLLVLGSGMFGLDGQTLVGNQVRKDALGLAIPHGLHSELLALGGGVREKGKERVSLTGQWTEKGATRSVLVIMELDGKCSIRDGGKAVAHDGVNSNSSAGNLSDDEEDLLEIFSEDSAEGVFFNTGGQLRIVGTGVNPTGKTPYQGILYNVLEVSTNAFVKNSKIARKKHFYFNSRTGDLEIVRYFTSKGNRNIMVETRRENWKQVNGRNIPGLITRLEDGQVRFSFLISSAVVNAAVADGAFSGR